MPNSTITARANVGTGADLLATVDTPQGKAGAVAVVLSTGVDVGTGNPFPVSVGTLPLPSGAATEATVAAISTKTPALGQALAAASSPVVIASNQSAVPISGAVTGSGTFTSGGPAAHSAVASGNPVQVGGVVAVAVSIAEVAGDVCRSTMTTGGALVTKGFSVPEVDWAYAATAGGIATTTDVVIAAAAGASVRNYLAAISVTNASATIATEVVIKDGATVIWRETLGTQMLPSSAAQRTFPIPLRGSANTALSVACVTIGAAVYVNAQGYIAP